MSSMPVAHDAKQDKRLRRAGLRGSPAFLDNDRK
jgi:hypothetical protein